jgi:single-strand DNA-binding protein
MFNKVVLVGNLTREIEMRPSNSGGAIANSVIVTSRKFKSQNDQQKEEVCFIDITFFGRTAEVAQQYLHKGSKLLIEGRLVFDQWTDQNGQKRSKHSVTVEIMQMLDTKIGTDQDNPGIQQQSKASVEQKSQSENPVEIPFGDEIKEEDIPF